MAHHRITKNKKALQRMKDLPITVIDRQELDRNVFTIVLKQLYEHSDKIGLHLENEILAPYNIKIPQLEVERLWNVLLSSNWVTPAVGFGNAGKLELTKTGYQLMSQFGGYIEYLTAMYNQQQQQTFVMPITVADDNHPDQNQLVQGKK